MIWMVVKTIASHYYGQKMRFHKRWFNIKYKLQYFTAQCQNCNRITRGFVILAGFGDQDEMHEKIVPNTYFKVLNRYLVPCMHFDCFTTRPVVEERVSGDI